MSTVVITTTVSSKEKAAAMARDLVSQRLAACVHVLPVDSVYIWRDELLENPEQLLQIKTTSNMYPAVSRWIKEQHDYDVPEILCTKVDDGDKDYLDWIGQSVRP